MILQFRRFHIMSLLMTLLVFAGIPSSIFGAWNQPPVQFTNTFDQPAGALASDTSGNSITLAFDSTLQQLNATYFTNGAYQAPVAIYTGNVSTIALAMDATGTAVAAWVDGTTNNLITGFFDGANWSTPLPNPLDTNVSASNFNPPSISMNGNGEALLVWLSLTSDLRFSQFTAGNWSAPITIELLSETTTVAYSANGTGVLGNTTGGTVNVRNFIGGVWQPAVILGFAPAGKKVEVGINNNGNAIAVWTDAINNLVTSNYVSGIWLAPQIIATNVSPFGGSVFSIAMAPGGTAIAVWIDGGTGSGFSRSFNGLIWTPQQQFSAGGIGGISELDVSVDLNGNALVVYSLNDPDEFRSNYLPLGGVWGPEEFIANTSVNNTNFVISSLSTEVGFALWETDDGEGGGDLFGSFTIFAPTPPVSIDGRVCKNKFASQTDRIHIFAWEPSIDPLVVSYNIRRNGILIANIPAAGPFIYYDHNRCNKNTDTYAVSAVSSLGIESPSLTINLR
jgi:hypothetical protein